MSTTAPNTATSPLTAALAGRLTTNARACLAALAEHPLEDTPRLMLRDELMDSVAWDWPTVRDLVLDAPACDGRRLLAAMWFEDAGERERAEFVRVQLELARLPDFRQNRQAAEAVIYGLDPEMIGERERAEFVRVQLELARLPDFRQNRQAAEAVIYGLDPEMIEKSRRAGELLTRERSLCPGDRLYHGTGPYDYVTVGWRRGFVESINGIRTADWLVNGDTIIAEHPVREVRLNGWMEWLDANMNEAATATGIEYPALASQVMEAYLRQRWPRVKVWHLPAAEANWDAAPHATPLEDIRRYREMLERQSRGGPAILRPPGIAGNTTS